MCTLTLLRERWLREGEGTRPIWRVVFNRDEQRSRPPALPPAVHAAGTVRALHPVDPQGGGTWIAATEHGLVLAVLNGDEPAVPDTPGMPARLSRGTIIPTLAAAVPARRAADVPVRVLDPRAYRPFHLVVADEHDLVEIRSDGHAATTAAPDRSDRLIRTSSSVETAAVRAWRIGLFGPPGTPASAGEQDAFHALADPGRPAYGVAMTRADARTVSVTTVEVFAGTVRMTYRPLPGAGPANVTELARTP